MLGKGLNIMLVDAAGDMAAVEKWYDQQAVLGLQDERSFFPNAFITPRMQDLLPDRSDKKNAICRFANLSKIFQQVRSCGAYREQLMTAVLCNHAADGSVCRPGLDNQADGMAFLYQ